MSATEQRHRPASGIALVTLVVGDYDEALAFYVGALGFDLLEDTTLSPSKRWVVVAPLPGRGAALLLARADGKRQRARIGDQTGGRVALILVTTDFDGDHERMTAAGVRFTEAPVGSPTAPWPCSSTPTATSGTFCSLDSRRPSAHDPGKISVVRAALTAPGSWGACGGIRRDLAQSEC